MDQPLFEKLDSYIQELLAPEDVALTQTIQLIKDEGLPPHSISANQGKFLQLLARLSRSKRILELGTLGGYSTIWLARALPADGRLISLEIDAHHASVARKNIARASLSALVDIRVGNALELLSEWIQKDEAPFDLIFIDADKPPYTQYFELALRLSHPGTLLIFDNVIREGQVLDESSPDEKVRGVQRFNEMLGSCREVDATILQTVGAKEHDGMAIAVVKERGR